MNTFHITSLIYYYLPVGLIDERALIWHMGGYFRPLIKVRIVHTKEMSFLVTLKTTYTQKVNDPTICLASLISLTFRIDLSGILFTLKKRQYC